MAVFTTSNITEFSTSDPRLLAGQIQNITALQYDVSVVKQFVHIQRQACEFNVSYV
jgi:hypothetical protein